MVTTINRWGNSLGVRLPKSMLVQLHMQENSQVEVNVRRNAIIIGLVKEQKRHISLADRLKDWDGERIVAGEMDWGEPAGEEVW